MKTIKKDFVFYSAVAFLFILTCLSLFPHLICSYSPLEQKQDAFLLTPNSTHFLGTDELGRDLLARILAGARISLACAFISTLIAAVLGITYGALAGYVEGKTDSLLMRIIDVLYSVPDLLFFILLGLFLGRDFWGMVIALSSLSWLSIARLTRAEVIKYKNYAFVEASRSQAASSKRILIKDILPQLQEPIRVTLLFKIPSVILAESTLSFIGLGLRPPFASWGTLAGDSYSALQFYPHLVFFPCLFIFLALFSFQILAQRLHS